MPITSRPVAKLNIEVDKEDYKNIRLRLLKEDSTISEFVRDAIKKYLKKPQ